MQLNALPVCPCCTQTGETGTVTNGIGMVYFPRNPIDARAEYIRRGVEDTTACRLRILNETITTERERG
jgi:hypothetical protein